MNVKKMINYGNGIVESLSNPEYKKIERQMLLPVIRIIYKEIGFFGLLKLLYRCYFEENKMRRHNWFNIEKNGVPKDVFKATFQLIAFMKVLDNMLGKEKAKRIITKIYEETEKKLTANKSAVNMFLIPGRDLKACKDSFWCFKEYTKATVNAGKQENFHDSEIIKDTNDFFSFDVHYCVAHEVAVEYGNAAWSFPWCEIDEVVYPRLGAQLGFKYSRSGSLPDGASKCDFRFERLCS